MISISIITLNEEKWLPSCLESVKDIAGEIIVVDSGSTDRTVEIARKYGAKVYFRKFDNYANQKNFAEEKCAGEWILSMDGDEEISSDLADEIVSSIKYQVLSIKKQNTPGVKKSNGLGNRQYTAYNILPVAYSIPRKNIIFGKVIKYTRWQPELDRHIWLWKKRHGKWEGDVHEEVVVHGQVGKLKHAKIHHQYETVKDFFDMMNRYSEIDALERVKNEQIFSYARLLIDPVYNFLVRYFYRLGFLDGWRGFVLSYLMGVYHLIVWIKVWEKDVNIKYIQISNKYK